jgi:hypothetical protein
MTAELALIGPPSYMVSGAARLDLAVSSADARWMRRAMTSFLLFLVVLVGSVSVGEIGEHRHSRHGIAQAAERTVIFNTKSRIYHHDGCSAARACTVNCVTMPLSEAVSRGGRPCGRCGG